MKISVQEAAGQLPDLIARAEAGEEVILVREGKEVARIAAVPGVTVAGRKTLKEMTKEEADRFFADLQASARSKALPGPSAARSQDFLYDEFGLPK